MKTKPFLCDADRIHVRITIKLGRRNHSNNNIYPKGNRISQIERNANGIVRIKNAAELLEE